MPPNLGNGEQYHNVQLYGVLMKKPFAHQSSKWSKRFFIIKDGFLLYYSDGEKKEFEKKRFFNIHPKGAIPLGGCDIQPVEENGHPFSIHITNDNFNGVVALSTDTGFERDKWVNMLRISSRVTFKNSQLGEAMIQQLEDQGLQMAQDKHDLYGQLQTEATALQAEKEKTEELERIQAEMEKEKEEMEQLSEDLRSEYDKLKEEMKLTAEAMQNIEEDKHELMNTTSNLQANIEALAKEKEKTLGELRERQNVANKLSQEKEDLSKNTDELKEMLKKIEDQMQRLHDDRMQAENRLRENEEQSVVLQEEKNSISDHATELEESIKELTTQKQITENELKEEVKARYEAENRLKVANESLSKLDKTLMVAGTTQSDGNKTYSYSENAQEEMSQSVKNLKRFFENVAFEAQLDAKKPVLMKNALNTRKAYVRRAKTLRYEARKQTSKTRSTATIMHSTRMHASASSEEIFVGGEPLNGSTRGPIPMGFSSLATKHPNSTAMMPRSNFGVMDSKFGSMGSNFAHPGMGSEFGSFGPMGSGFATTGSRNVRSMQSAQQVRRVQVSKAMTNQEGIAGPGGRFHTLGTIKSMSSEEQVEQQEHVQSFEEQF